MSAPGVIIGATRRGCRAVRMPQARRSKYGAVRCEVGGHTFASLAEGRYYRDLKAREQAGEVMDIELQPVFVLRVGETVIGSYRADFRHKEWDGRNWVSIVTDVKGMKTLPLAKWKQKHVKVEYGVTVQEIRR